jgi:hypothetical protein
MLFNFRQSLCVPYSSSDKTSIWGSTLDEGADGGMQTSSLRKADESYCPYCYAIDPTMGEDYNECLQYNKEDCNAQYGEACSIHGEASLPISDEIFPLMFFALFYLIYRYKNDQKKYMLVHKKKLKPNEAMKTKVNKTVCLKLLVVLFSIIASIDSMRCSPQHLLGLLRLCSRSFLHKKQLYRFWASVFI